MNQVYFPSLLFVLPAFATLLTAAILLVANPYGHYLRISRGKAALLSAAALLASVVAAVSRDHQFHLDNAGFGFLQRDFAGGYSRWDKILTDLGLRDSGEFGSLALAFMLPLAAIPFLTKFYLTWIAGAVTEAEKAPGMEGIRAWLRGGNLFCGVLVSVSLWLGFGCSFWMPIALALMALLAFPVLNIAMTAPAPQTTAPEGDALSPHRERVLKMLDEGKITAQESAELLNALGHSAPMRAPQSAVAPWRPAPSWRGLARHC
jgi:hypothetical protein